MPDPISLKMETNIAVVMRDGITLYADVYRPDGHGPFPTILQRTPYDKSASLTSTMLDPIRAAQAGFAVVIQDTRGRHASEGEFYAFRDDIEDGYDTVEWAAAQPWSNGKVGMYGASYVGATQWLAATARPPHLVTIAPTVTASNYHDGWTYQGGAFELGFNMSWTLLQLTLANFKNVSGAQDVPLERRMELVKAVDGMTEGFRSLPTKDYPHLDSGLAKYYYDWKLNAELDAFIKDKRARLELESRLEEGYRDKEILEMAQARGFDLISLNRLISQLESELERRKEMLGIPLENLVEFPEEPIEPPIEKKKLPTPPETPTPKESGRNRGFFTNSISADPNGLNNGLDPTALAVIGILITLAATGVQLVKGN